MSARIYPGKGLSLSQLIFALSEELKCVAYSPSYVKEPWILGERLADSLHRFTLDQVSQFDLGTSATLATIREWRNSFVPINRVPLEILSLISSNLSSQEDRHIASFVCRHWRRTFIRCPELWSQLTLSKGEVYMKTFLERAKGTPLDIIVDHEIPVQTMTPLSFLTNQIRTFHFLGSGWADIQKLSEVISGPLPLLHTLTVDFVEENDLDDLEDIQFSLPLFTSAVNLKVLQFHSIWDQSPFILHLAFPNLVSFDLSTEHWAGFPALRLLDFLEGSPMLQIVKMQVLAYISFEGVIQERVVCLPSVEHFTLTVGDGAGYEMAAHIHCPSARVTAIVRKARINVFLEEIFPTLVFWNAIVRQYTTSPPEEATLEIWSDDTPLICKLAFESSDSTSISLGFEKVPSAEFDAFNTEALIPRISAQATRTIRSHPQLANIKRLHIHNDSRPFGLTADVASEVKLLFNSLGPLDEMTIYQWDLGPYLRLVLEDDEEEEVSFPPVKELMISRLTNLFDCASVVKLAKSQHARGIPFERMVIRGVKVAEGIGEGLRPWVGSVEYNYE